MLTPCLLAAGLLLVWLGLHPFTSYPLSLAVLARLRPLAFRRGPTTDSVAICVCAYNEAAVIRAKIENMLALRATLPTLQILVYVDGSADGTADIVQSFGDRIDAIISARRNGKTHGMNLLVARARADLVVFSDANVMFAPDALTNLITPFADPDVGCVCGHLIYTSRDGGATASTGSLYWRLEEYIKRQESRTGSVMGADGSIFAIRRALHCPPPPDLIDDMFVSISILCAGKRIVSAADAYAYEEAVAHAGEEFRRKQRIACQAFNVHRALHRQLQQLGWLDSYKYVSHKLLRWLTIYFLGAGALLVAGGVAAAGAWLLLVLAVAVCAGLVPALLLLKSGRLIQLRDVIVAFVATGIGVLRSLRGDRFQTWEPPASARQPTISESPAS